MNDDEASRLQGHRDSAHIAEGLLRASETGGELLDVVHASAELRQTIQSMGDE